MVDMADTMPASLHHPLATAFKAMHLGRDTYGLTDSMATVPGATFGTRGDGHGPLAAIRNGYQDNGSATAGVTGCTGDIGARNPWSTQGNGCSTSALQ